MFRVCHTCLSVHCSLVITCWERANLVALLYVMVFLCFCHFPCGLLDQVWNLIVSIPDLCLLTYIYMGNTLSPGPKPQGPWSLHNLVLLFQICVQIRALGQNLVPFHESNMLLSEQKIYCYEASVILWFSSKIFI